MAFDSVSSKKEGENGIKIINCIITDFDVKNINREPGKRMEIIWLLNGG